MPSNIAEGSGRNTPKDFNNFLGFATESLYELETQLILSKRLDFIISENELKEVLASLHSIQRRTYNFKQKLK